MTGYRWICGHCGKESDNRDVLEQHVCSRRPSGTEPAIYSRAQPAVAKGPRVPPSLWGAERPRRAR